MGPFNLWMELDLWNIYIYIYIRITKFCEGIVSQHNTTNSQSRIILIHFLTKESMLRLYSCGDSTPATTTIVNVFSIASKTSGLASNATINLHRPWHE